jgi:hypothetical protein
VPLIVLPGENKLVRDDDTMLSLVTLAIAFELSDEDPGFIDETKA